MEISTLKKALLDFATNPCKSWGPTTSGADPFVGRQARVTIEQSDRNTARLRSGTHTAEQLADFEHQCKLVETHGGTAYFSPEVPNSLEFNPVCVDCDKPFSSCKADANRCYECELKALCPPLPWRSINHHWFYNDHEWTMEVFGDIGGRNRLTFWWHNRNSCGNVGHQGLIVDRDAYGKIKKLIFSTAATHARRCYHIEWDIEAGTTQFFVSDGPWVNREFKPTDQVDELDPLALDLILAMIPTWMLFAHRPRNSSNGCFAV